jgi:hypothetical protein
MDLQEMIIRGRFIFSEAPGRLSLFELVDGRRGTHELAAKVRRHVNNVRRDLTKIENAGLIQPKLGKDSAPPIYEKVPLARTIPAQYFRVRPSPPRPASPPYVRNKQAQHKPAQRRKPLPIPTEEQILNICGNGEDQLYEFKAAGTDARKIAREACAMMNTKEGGIIFYGVDDNGKVMGSDVSRQQLDQPLQNSIRNSISPAATISLKAVKVIKSEVLLIIVPPWNRRDVYQFDERVLIRKGTSVFAAKAEELKKLHQGRPVV